MGKRNSSNNRKRPTKINLVFDENKRKEFLCGFRKRKLERKKKAQDDLQRMLKEEKRRIKLENKESYKKLVVSSRPIPELEKLLQDEYEDEDVNVKIVELPSSTFNQDKWIGDNKPKADVEKTKPTKVEKHTKSLDSIPGMDLEESVEKSESDTEQEENNIKTKKDIKRILKHQATKKIQKSKVFQLKNKMEKIKNRKKSLQKSNAKNKLKNKKEKSRGGSKKKHK